MSKADELQGQLDAIYSMAQPDGIWSGPAASGYQVEFDRWAAAQRTMVDALRDVDGAVSLGLGEREAVATVHSGMHAGEATPRQPARSRAERTTPEIR